MIPIGKIEKIAVQAPENLIFYSTASLIAVVSDTVGRYSEECKRESLAELIIRWYLNQSSELEKCFDSVFPQKEWHSLKKIKEREIFSVPSASGLPGTLWKSSDAFIDSCEVATRRRLSKLLNADGFIPVYFESEAFFLPFFLEESDHLPLICDAAENPIENWLQPYQELFGKNPKYRCVVFCRQENYLPELTGHSLMLPLYLAYNRKNGTLPQYNKIRLLSTGAIEHNQLRAVETAEKAAALHLCFRNAFLFFPESSRIHSEEPASIPLNITFNLEETLEEIRKQIEARGLVVPTFKDAQKRLEELDYETRHNNQNHWDLMLARLQTNMNAIQLSRERAPEFYLLCLMLKSAMFCHNGDTKQALKYNEEAKAEARALHLEKPLRRLEIEELVDLQDVEAFESIHSVAGILKEEIEQSKDDDLLMRYYGTMGQAHCYGFLAGVQGFEKDIAKAYFVKALHHAQILDSEQDIAQDLNYNYLWYVLFEPASENAFMTYRMAWDHITRNLQDYPQCQKKNYNFLQRLKLQVLYRRLLSGESIPALDYQEEDLPTDAVFWLRALGKKYLGAIAASHGKHVLAEQYFQDADALLEKYTSDNIIAFIRMTILAEAYRSLHGEFYQKKAEEALTLLKEQYKSLRVWRGFLNKKAPFPGLSYWY